MITDNTAKWQVKSLNTPIANSGDGKLPVGHIYISMGSSAPAGSLPLWGQLFSRSTYKDLWDWVNKHPEQLLSESEWQTKYIENNGLVPFYSDGTDSTNFRVPNCFNLGSDMMDYVVEDWQQGQNWYRVWKSGWVEQGGGFTVKNDYVTETITFRKPFKNTTYYASAMGDYTSSTANSEVITNKTTNSITFAGVHNTNGNANWTAKGYGTEIPQTERVLWCVKAFGNIEESTGSTSLTNIANNITQLNTKVDNWVSGTLDSHATAIAKMQSYFNGNFEKTLLAGGTTKTEYIGSGDVTLKDSWKNYDGLLIYCTNDSNEGIFRGDIVWKKELEDLLELATSSSKTYFSLGGTYNGQYYYFKVATTTEILFPVNSQDSGIQAIYGIRLKATGITNKSAIDVSQMQAKIGSLLTPDNHLILPSGLEVW